MSEKKDTINGVATNDEIFAIGTSYDDHIIDYFRCTLDTLIIKGNLKLVYIGEGCTINTIKIDQDAKCKQIAIESSIVHNLIIDNGLIDELRIGHKADVSCTVSNDKCKSIQVAHNLNARININDYKDSLLKFDSNVGQISSLLMSKVKSIDSLRVRHSKIENANIYQSNLKKLSIESTASKLTISNIDTSGKGQLTFLIEANGKDLGSSELVLFQCANSVIDQLDLSDFSKIHKSDFIFNSVVLQEANLKNFSANKSKFEIHFGSIDNLIFENTTLNNSSILERVTIRNFTLISSYIEEVKFLYCVWPNEYQINLKQLNGQDYEFKFQRESYAQLARIISKYDSPLEGVRFKLHERDIYLKENYKKRRDSTFFSKPYWDSLGNTWLLWLDKQISNYGQNIWRPFLLLFAFHFIWVCLMTSCNYQLGISFGREIDWGVTKKAINLYFQTILPVHSSSVTIPSDSSPVPIGGFLDFLARLTSGYFIYYFLRATRKFHI